MRAPVALAAPPAPSGWQRTWIACAAASGALAIAANAVAVLHSAPVVRLRDAGWLPILRRLAERADVDLLAALPVAVSWHVSSPGARTTLLLANAIANAIFSALLAMLALPAFALVTRRLAEPSRVRLAAAAGLGLFALPAIELPLARALRNVPSGPTLLWSGALTLLLALALWLLLSPRRAGVVGRLATRTLALLVLACSVAGACSLLASARTTSTASVPSNAPNVLLISIDSLRPDHLGCYGYPRDTSPTLDALAREGARFATVVSSSSWTLPAHVTLFTGLSAEQHGVIFDERRIADEAVTLAEVLHAAGFQTGGVASGPYLEAGFGFAQGFDHYDDWSANRASNRFSHRGSTSPDAIAAARRFVDQTLQSDTTRPFFLFLHLWDVHYDYEPPPPWDTHFDPDYRGTVTGRDFESGQAVHAGMDPRDLAHVIALYDGEIRHTDESLAGLFDDLRAHGVLDHTLVAVLSDHGDEFFEHGHKGHRKNLYDTTILVPWMVRWPGHVAAGRVVPEQVRLQDVAPTVLGLIGIPPSGLGRGSGGTHVGRDLAAFLAPGARGALPPAPATSDLHGKLASLRTDTEKWISGPKGDELYDLSRDPAERQRLTESRPERTAALRAALAALRESRGDDVARPFDLDEAQRDRLRALGYLQ